MTNTKNTSSLKFGIEPIDSHHQKLFQILQSLVNDIHQQSVHTNEIIEELEAYTHYHFNTEENLMRKFNYSKMDEHIAQHKIFKQKVIDFKISQSFQSATINEEIVNFLRKWLLNHILDYDGKYVDTFKRNLKPENEENLHE